MSWSSSSSPKHSSSSPVLSNLESFLSSVTPVLPSKPLPQGCVQDLNSQWQPVKKGITKYFTLSDLWECYDEWSAYGAGTPVVLNNGENVVQYYVPYLSAIQIYVNKSSATSRNPRYDTDPVEFEVDSWSDDSESDKLSRSLSNNSSKAWDATSADSSIDHEGALPMKDRLGNLYFEYYDTCSPYWRIPLVDKIIEFAQTYPGLMTLKNVDLSPASWMAVAWYPIYHIPTKGNVKDLSACFLTFHTLSSSFQGIHYLWKIGREGLVDKGVVEYSELLRSFILEFGFAVITQGLSNPIAPLIETFEKGQMHKLLKSFFSILMFHALCSTHSRIDDAVDNDEEAEDPLLEKSKGKGSGKIFLPPFGLATYKMQGDVWINSDASEYGRLIDLHSAADSWLKQLNVLHHDFNFFTSHSTVGYGTCI
ncbi:hypothetical protein RJ639_042371 [Escallonia herrerae]|uniref:Uncharacterized protein n=1 Tax=Escallonia herrerae TaxID=1293975 RepID=A0AA88WI62_9ASTE|nr:hypothetical protein RJ639_042371 [Escallonia herrerae]